MGTGGLTRVYGGAVTGGTAHGIRNGPRWHDVDG